jgi:hypothetical protein
MQRTDEPPLIHTVMSGKHMKFRIEGDNMDAIDDPTPADVEAVLDMLHPRDRCFFSLTDTETGSYVQAAGARIRLTVEARQCADEGFTHSVLGRLPRDPGAACINCRVGPITLARSQVLTLEDAKQVFLHFLATGELAQSYEIEDVTSRFQEGT